MNSRESRCNRVGIDRRFEHGVPRAIEANELPRHTAMHHRHLDARPWRRTVDRSDLQLAPGAAVRQHHTAHRDRRPGRILGIGNRRAREHPRVVDEIDDRRLSGHNVAIGGGIEERLQHDDLVAPLDAHRCAIHMPVRIDRRHDALDNHRERTQGVATTYPVPTWANSVASARAGAASTFESPAERRSSRDRCRRPFAASWRWPRARHGRWRGDTGTDTRETRTAVDRDQPDPASASRGCTDRT